MKGCKMTQFALIGRKSVAIGGEVFSSELVADDLGSITVSPAMTEVKTQLGTRKYPNGGYDELSAKFNIIIPDMQTLGRVFPSLYKKASFKGANGTDTGRVEFGAIDCKTVEPVPVVVHPECNADSSQDICFPKAMVAMGASFNFKAGSLDPIEVDITPMTPDDGSGAVQMGEGNLTASSLYDALTQKYKPIASGH